jgi:ankyrin repeat protein
VDRKASTNVQDIDGDTALMIAAASGNDILVKTVLDGKPDLSLKNKKGETAYMIADKAGYSYLLPLLEVKVNAQTVQGKDDGTCSPTMVHIFKGKAVEIVLKASKDEMFLLTAPDLGLELMAMPGESVSQTITPDKKGTFPFTCGVHGAEKQTKGSFMVM